MNKIIITEFIKNYPIHGKKWCIDNLKITDGQIRYYAQKYNLKSNFKFNALSNYNRGSSFRNKKRPEHSKLLKDRNFIPANYFTNESKNKISNSLKIAIKNGKFKTDNFKGHKHSLESKNKISVSLTGRIKSKETIKKTLNTKMIKYGKLGGFNKENTYSRCKRGYYNINGIQMYFRSLWEANYALYLDFLVKNKNIDKWEYEIDTFWFEKIKRGIRSYTPDFKIFNNDGTFEYHEVKGWMDNKSKTKIKRMAKYYPDTKLIVIESSSYKDIIKKAPITFFTNN